MRLINLLLAATLTPLLAIAPTGPASDADAAEPAFLASKDASPADYGTCPAAETICYYYHGPTAVVTSYCTGFDCFEMTYFEQARTVAADDEGPFPRTFMAWFTEKKTATPWTSWSSVPCVVERSGNKFKLTFPEGSILCGAGLLTTEAAYYWHAASNPETGCLGIGECKVPLVYDPLSVAPAE